jgi:hypothetical protein
LNSFFEKQQVLRKALCKNTTFIPDCHFFMTAYFLHRLQFLDKCMKYEWLRQPRSSLIAHKKKRINQEKKISCYIVQRGKKLINFANNKYRINILNLIL